MSGLATASDFAEVIDRMLEAVDKLETEHPLDVADARRYGTFSAPLRTTFVTYEKIFRGTFVAVSSSESSDPDLGAVFARVFSLAIFESIRDGKEVLADDMILSLLGQDRPAYDLFSPQLLPGDLYGALETVLSETLKPWAATVERQQNDLVAVLRQEIAGLAPYQATMCIHLETDSAWTCALTLRCPSPTPSATFSVRQRKGMQALMRRKRDGKTGTELVQAIFSTKANAQGETHLAALANVLVELENDDVSATLDEAFELKLPFLPATPSGVSRGSNLAATAWAALLA